MPSNATTKRTRTATYGASDASFERTGSNASYFTSDASAAVMPKSAAPAAVNAVPTPKAHEVWISCSPWPRAIRSPPIVVLRLRFFMHDLPRDAPAWSRRRVAQRLNYAQVTTVLSSTGALKSPVAESNTWTWTISPCPVMSVPKRAPSRAKMSRGDTSAAALTVMSFIRLAT